MGTVVGTEHVSQLILPVLFFLISDTSATNYLLIVVTIVIKISWMVTFKIKKNSYDQLI